MTRILLVVTAMTILSGGVLAGCASDGGYATWSKREEAMTPLKKRTDRGGGLSGN